MRFVNITYMKESSAGATPEGHENWLGYWETKKGQSAGQCAVMGCGKKAEQGGQAAMVGDSSKRFVLPLCPDCSGKPEGFVFRTWDTDLVALP